MRYEYEVSNDAEKTHMLKKKKEKSFKSIFMENTL